MILDAVSPCQATLFILTLKSPEQQSEHQECNPLLGDLAESQDFGCVLVTALHGRLQLQVQTE
jgi:hypothetical protein